MAKCKSCGADIIWIKTKNGRAMPCDSKPIPFRESFSGGMKLVTKEGHVFQGHYDKTSESIGYISHFATCPYADNHRRRS